MKKQLNLMCNVLQFGQIWRVFGLNLNGWEGRLSIGCYEGKFLEYFEEVVRIPQWIKIAVIYFLQQAIFFLLHF